MSPSTHPMDQYATKIIFTVDKVIVEFYPSTYDEVCKIINNHLNTTVTEEP